MKVITIIKHIKSMHNDKHTDLIKLILLINCQKTIEVGLNKKLQGYP